MDNWAHQQFADAVDDLLENIRQGLRSGSVKYRLIRKMNCFELYPKYKRSLFFFFNKEKSNISGFEFTKGKKIEVTTPLHYNVEKIDSYLDEYDYLPVSSGPPLVSKKFKELFNDCEKEHQIQLF